MSGDVGIGSARGGGATSVHGLGSARRAMVWACEVWSTRGGNKWKTTAEVLAGIKKTCGLWSLTKAGL